MKTQKRLPLPSFASSSRRRSWPCLGWVSIELNTGMVAFMHPDTRTPFRTDKTFFCQGRESNRPLGCSTLSVTALDMGVVTDLTLVRSPDR